MSAAAVGRPRRGLHLARADGRESLRGEPVAKIVPAESEKPDRAEALRRLLARLDAQPALNLPRIRRDELYDD